MHNNIVPITVQGHKPLKYNQICFRIIIIYNKFNSKENAVYHFIITPIRQTWTCFCSRYERLK